MGLLFIALSIDRTCPYYVDTISASCALLCFSRSPYVQLDKQLNGLVLIRPTTWKGTNLVRGMHPVEILGTYPSGLIDTPPRGGPGGINLLLSTVTYEQ